MKLERYDIFIRVEGESSSSSNNSSERQLHLPESAHFIKEDDIVGIRNEREQLVEWLTDGNPTYYMISVCGMGGLGKTTLVTKVYESQVIRKHFDCYACVSVSQSYRTDDLLKRILKDFFEREEGSLYDIDAMAYRNLVEIVRSYLDQKRYLVILDDVWSTNVWYGIADAFYGGEHGSKIVITTRKKDIASLAVESRILELQTLDKNDALNLFCRKAFCKDEDRRCPQVLEPWAEKIVLKCEGLPLAIGAMGSLLSLRKKDESEWRKFYEQLNWELTNSNEINWVVRIFNLSYNDLPGYLKNCFLYCSIFPEDYLIKRKRLIRVWIAEGFIEGRGTQTMEEVAEDYLNQLILRCMLQVVKRNVFGRVKGCRMHDLVRELTLSLAKKENFSVICDDPDVVILGDEAPCLSVHKSRNNMQLSTSLLHLRSFIVFDTTLSSSLLHSVSSKLRLLRVLDLQGAPIEKVPDEVFRLFNLHHLGLRYTQVKKLPDSLGRLHNLQTLDLAFTNIKKLPSGISKLINLRHLFAEKILDKTAEKILDKTSTGVPAPKGIWDLRCLQTLQCVEANGNSVRQVGSLTQLRSLGITRVRHRHCAELCNSITKMHHLVSLDIYASEEQDGLQLDALNPPPHLLEKLWLEGRLEERWVLESSLFRALINLKRLVLSQSGLREDPLPSLRHLSNLSQLSLFGAYNGQQLCFRRVWFPNLKRLTLGYLAQLSVVEVEEGTMPNSEDLHLIGLGELKQLPQGIQCVSFSNNIW